MQACCEMIGKRRFMVPLTPDHLCNTDYHDFLVVMANRQSRDVDWTAILYRVLYKWQWGRERRMKHKFYPRESYKVA